ncbi:GNAT family N-acetyltransferase [Arachidicoccus ginsenosidivorans]|nr:GNAT family N-acetyltransferase [Arachidicoccus ginsenosidivorans]
MTFFLLVFLIFVSNQSNFSTVMEATYYIRETRYGDLPAILEIMNESIRNSTAIYEEEPRNLAYVEHWLEAQKKSGMPVFSCLHNEATVGYGTYGQFRPKYGYRFSVEHSVYVDEFHRGAGIGQLLLTALIDRAKADGLHRMIAGIDADNHGSIRFHEKNGFVKSGHLKEVGFKFGRF